MVVATVLAIPILAHGPDDGEPTRADGETWEAMHEACVSGDWEAMAEAAEEVHGEDLDYMPCHGEGDYTPNRWGGMAGHMVGVVDDELEVGLYFIIMSDYNS